MSALHIYLFGSVQIVHDDRPAAVRVKPSAQALLVYLLLFPHRCHRREVLIDLFWGNREEERARRCLSTTLWRLRSALEPAPIPHGTYLITTAAGEVGFNRESDYWSDVTVFEEKIAHGLLHPVTAMTAAEAQELEEALQLYTGDLLEGFYEEWALRERERLRALYLRSLARLMLYYHHHGVYERSLACGQKILDMDPLREEVHREMMRLYLNSGQRALAVQQYETCRRILAVELNIPPMAETQTLYAQMVSVADQHPEQVSTDNEPGNLKKAMQQLDLAMRGLDEAREQLRRAAQIVLRLSEKCGPGPLHPEE